MVGSVSLCRQRRLRTLSANPRKHIELIDNKPARNIDSSFSSTVVHPARSMKRNGTKIVRAIAYVNPTATPVPSASTVGGSVAFL